jgi:S-layer homology domain
MSPKRFIYLVGAVILLLLPGFGPAVRAGAAHANPWRQLSGAAVSAPPAGPAYTGEAGVPLASPVPCIPPFDDVDQSNYFYEAVRYLYCHGAVSGYGNRSFKPAELVTRAQITKMVVLGLDLPYYTPTQPSFEDVPPENPFYEYIESYSHYAGSCLGGCSSFHPYSDSTRGQVAKIIVLASCWPLYTPPVATFSDVTTDSTFYQYIETAYDLGVISGYADATFRPYNNITRGQVSKIVYRAMLQGSSCETASPTPVPAGKPRP